MNNIVSKVIEKEKEEPLCKKSTFRRSNAMTDNIKKDVGIAIKQYLKKDVEKYVESNVKNT